MTDYVDALRDALHEAAVREYPARGAVGLRPSRRRGPRRSGSVRGARRLTVAAAAVAASILAVVVLSVGQSTPAAYALVRHHDGSVTVTIRNLQHAIKPLNARFAALGVHERIIPMTRGCPTRAGFVGIVTRSELTNLPYTFTVRRTRRFFHGIWGYLSISRARDGRFLYAQGAMTPPLPTCLERKSSEVVVRAR